MASFRSSTMTVIRDRTSWGPISSPSSVDPIKLDRPLSGNFDRIFNKFEKTNAFEYIRNTVEGKEDRHVGHGDVVVNRRMNSSYERADCVLAARTPSSEDEDFFKEKIMYSQTRQLFPLQEDLADWINKTIGITYLTGENFLDTLDNGADLCQMAAIIHDRAREALDQGLIVGPVPAIRGRCWQRAARRSFFSRDNTENFITFCQELGVHENLLFESDDLVLHNNPRQVILCLLEVARLATKFNVEPPGLVQLEKEIAMEERDSGLDSAMSMAGRQFRDVSPEPIGDKSTIEPLPTLLEPKKNVFPTTEKPAPDNTDTESTKSGGTIDSTDSDVSLQPINELDKRVQLMTRLMERSCNCAEGKCSRILKVKKVSEGRYKIAGRNVFIRLLKGQHMMVRVGGGWDTLEHFLSRHDPCQVLLVRQGQRSKVLPLDLPQKSKSSNISPDNSKESSIVGTISPVESTSSSLSGKISPVHSKTNKANDAKKSPQKNDWTNSTPIKSRKMNLFLPLKTKFGDDRQQNPAQHTRKLSSQSFSTPNTPTNKKSNTPQIEQRAPLSTNSVLTPTKKSRSVTLATLKDEKMSFCGTDRLNNTKKCRSSSTVTTTTNKVKLSARNTVCPNVASKPSGERKKSYCGTENINVKKITKKSLSVPVMTFHAVNESSSITQAAIEDRVKISLAPTIGDTNKKPFLHIKAKYRPSPASREVPPR